jgi:hypothetical protein
MGAIWLGRAQEMDDYDIARVAHEAGVSEDHIHAILDVECKGEGFDKRRRPAMLRERHIFYREIHPDFREEAVRRGLATPKWVRDYPVDSYPWLVEAYQLDANAALRSCSWGLGQIMGFNHRVVGYDTVVAMVRAFADDEANQLEAVKNFLVNNDLIDDLLAERWNVVAGTYNGPRYKVNNYHVRLKERYEWWKKKPDTPWTPALAREEEETARDDPSYGDPNTLPKPPGGSIFQLLFRAIGNLFGGTTK